VPMQQITRMVRTGILRLNRPTTIDEMAVMIPISPNASPAALAAEPVEVTSPKTRARIGWMICVPRFKAATTTSKGSTSREPANRSISRSEVCFPLTGPEILFTKSRIISPPYKKKNGGYTKSSFITVASPRKPPSSGPMVNPPKTAPIRVPMVMAFISGGAGGYQSGGCRYRTGKQPCRCGRLQKEYMGR
jgi:hypothetical protein